MFTNTTLVWIVRTVNKLFLVVKTISAKNYQQKKTTT